LESTVNPSSQPLLGAYFGNTAPAVEQSLAGMEQWLGREVDYALIFLNQSSWSGFDSSVQWALDQWPHHEKLLISVPLIPDGADLRSAAAGADDQHYRQAAQKIAAYDPNAVIRIGWEMNGDWYSWSAAPNPQGYIDAYRHAVDAFRSVSSGFKFVWSPNIGTGTINPEKVYPGDAYVDVVGLSVYEGSGWFSGKTPDQRWDWLMNQPNGLKWHHDFAAAHGKPMGYPEYASDINDGAFVTRMADWIKSNNVAFHSWWNRNDVFDGDLQTHLTNEQAYRAAWGPSAAPSPTPAPAPIPASRNTLVLHVAEDAWQGDAQFTVAVDGRQVGGLLTAKASHALGQWQDIALTGDWGAGPHRIDVTFTNDAWGGSPSADRNFYLGSVDYDGRHFADARATLYGNGTASFMIDAAPAPAPAPAPSTVVLHVSGDSGHGNPQFIVKVDGRQVGGTLSTWASHDAGRWQDVTVNLGPVDASKAHDLSISFINDAYGGSHATDTNLYVGGLEINGRHVDGNAFASNNASLGYDWIDGHAAVMVVNGAATYHLGSEYWHV
jgi:hypothetical protein